MFNLRKASSLTVPMEDVKQEQIASNPFLRAKLKAFMGHLNTKVTPADENELADSPVDPSMPADPMQKMTLRRYTA